MNFNSTNAKRREITKTIFTVLYLNKNGGGGGWVGGRSINQNKQVVSTGKRSFGLLKTQS